MKRNYKPKTKNQVKLKAYLKKETKKTNEINARYTSSRSSK